MHHSLLPRQCPFQCGSLTRVRNGTCRLVCKQHVVRTTGLICSLNIGLSSAIISPELIFSVYFANIPVADSADPSQAGRAGGS